MEPREEFTYISKDIGFANCESVISGEFCWIGTIKKVMEGLYARLLAYIKWQILYSQVSNEATDPPYRMLSSNV